MAFSLLFDGIWVVGGIPEEARWRLCNAVVGRRQMQMPRVRASSVENRRTACGELECILHVVAKGAGLAEKLSIGEAKACFGAGGISAKLLPPVLVGNPSCAIWWPILMLSACCPF